MNKIENQQFEVERSLYHLCDSLVLNCQFKGIKDGESPLKEARDVTLKDSLIDLRYPLWHDINLVIDNTTLTPNCRAALWYTKNLTITNSKLHGIKALRECENIEISHCDMISDEFGWRNHNLTISDSHLVGVYAFFESKNVQINNLTFTGKYSFQYVENMQIANSNFDTKDAFWHTKKVLVKDTVLKGEYLGWYSEDLTLVNCTIIGTQPLCYCKNLVLINCTMIDCDLAFEYSDVKASINGNILSVKNVTSGEVVADSIGEIIKEDSIYPLNGVIKIRENI